MTSAGNVDSTMHRDVRHYVMTVLGVTIHWAEVGTATAASPVLMPDLPGHGRSGRPDAPYDHSWYARVTAAWLEAIKLSEVDVVGHSLEGPAQDG